MDEKTNLPTGAATAEITNRADVQELTTEEAMEFLEIKHKKYLSRYVEKGFLHPVKRSLPEYQYREINFYNRDELALFKASRSKDDTPAAPGVIAAVADHDFRQILGQMIASQNKQNEIAAQLVEVIAAVANPPKSLPPAPSSAATLEGLNQKIILTHTEAVQLTGLNKSVFLNAINAGDLKAFRPRKKSPWHIRRADLDKFLETLFE